MHSSLYANPALYDAQYSTLARDRAFYAGLARRTGGPVLELATGSGRIAEAILATGVELVGLEVSRPMLDAATRRLAPHGVRCRLVEGDFRGFDLGATFPLVVCGFNSLCHVDPAGFAAVLGCVRAHLRGEGIFAFDLPNPGARAVGPTLRERFFDERDGVACEVWESVEPDADPRVWRRRWEYRWEDGRRAVETLQRWEYPSEEVRGMLEAAGFRVDDLFGDFAGTAFGTASSRQVWVVSPGTGRGSGTGGV
jgi:SAM-dependent methyltransferase